LADQVLNDYGELFIPMNLEDKEIYIEDISKTKNVSELSIFLVSDESLFEVTADSIFTLKRISRDKNILKQIDDIAQKLKSETKDPRNVSMINEKILRTEFGVIYYPDNIEIVRERAIRLLENKKDKKYEDR
jgi:hypothetical protein